MSNVGLSSTCALIITFVARNFISKAYNSKYNFFNMYL